MEVGLWPLIMKFTKELITAIEETKNKFQGNVVDMIATIAVIQQLHTTALVEMQRDIANLKIAMEGQLEISKSQGEVNRSQNDLLLALTKMTEELNNSLIFTGKNNERH